MLDFIYNAPTTVYFGRDKEKQVGKIISDLGYKKIMMQYGKGSIKKSGLYDSVMNSLSEYGIEVIELGGVEPNPKYDFINRAIKLAKKENAIGFLLPTMDKGELFPFVQNGRTLPRKTFSMGHGCEKRYYLEGRKIR